MQRTQGRRAGRFWFMGGCGAWLAVMAGGAWGQSPTEEARAKVEAARAALEAAEAELAAAEAAAAAEVPGVPEGAGEAPEVEQTSFWTGWEGTVEAGLAGATGNSENFNFRVALNAQRLTERLETKYDASYRYATSDGEDTANRFETGLRNDWLVRDSRWRYFAQGRYEFDEFQDWDHRVSAFGGVGYEFIKDDKTTLVGRAGLGGNATFGGGEDEFTPEGLLGVDYTRKLAREQELGLGTEVLLALDPVGDYRVNSYAEYKIMVNPENQMFLKAGAKHRWDSDPGDAERSDLEYYLTLGWGF